MREILQTFFNYESIYYVFLSTIRTIPFLAFCLGVLFLAMIFLFSTNNQKSEYQAIPKISDSKVFSFKSVDSLPSALSNTPSFSLESEGFSSHYALLDTSPFRGNEVILGSSLREAVVKTPKIVNEVGLEKQPSDSLSETPKNLLGLIDDEVLVLSDDEEETVQGKDSLEILVFDDLLCEYCERNFYEVLFPLSRSSLVEKNKINITFHTLPVHGEESLALGKVSWCAFDQGKGWEFLYDFYSVTNKSLKKAREIATALEFDVSAFSECTNSDEWTARIALEKRLQEEYQVQAAPTLRIGKNQFIGIIPLENIEHLIRKHLKITR